jgi:hypothetical protein
MRLPKETRINALDFGGVRKMERKILVAAALAVTAMQCVSLAAAQSETGRCDAARGMLTNANEMGLSNEELNYFRTVVQSSNCARGRTVQSRTVAPTLDLPSGPFSARQCNSSTARLAELQYTRQSETNEGKIQYHIWSSRDCQNQRRGSEIDVDPGVSAMMSKLKTNGLDVDAQMRAKIDVCRIHAASEANVATCILNARIAIYSSAINELNQKQNAEYNAKMENHRTELKRFEIERRKRAEKIIEDKAAYQKSLADWRRRVALCKQGQSKFCAQK